MKTEFCHDPPSNKPMLPSASIRKRFDRFHLIDGPQLTVRPGPSRAGRPNACGVAVRHLILRRSPAATWSGAMDTSSTMYSGRKDLTASLGRQLRDPRPGRSLRCRTAGTRQLGHGLRLDLQAAPHGAAACSRPRFHLAHRDREGSRTRDAATIQIQSARLHQRPA